MSMPDLEVRPSGITYKNKYKQKYLLYFMYSNVLLLNSPRR